jgi:hypothetical protein
MILDECEIAESLIYHETPAAARIVGYTDKGASDIGQSASKTRLS